MQRDIDALINGYLDDDLTTDELTELNDWIKADPVNARRFAQAVMLHNQLQTDLNIASENLIVESSLNAARPSGRDSTPFPRRNFATALVIAASLLAVIGFYSWQDAKNDSIERNPIAVDSFATVTQTVDVVWGDSKPLQGGSRIGAGAIELRSGIVRIQFDDGVEVTLQGPAEYALVAEANTKLARGLLTASVPPGAEGFRVDTPTLEVIDLGTEFGIRLDKHGASTVSVFDGEVEVSLKDEASKQRLIEGEAVSHKSHGEIERVAFDTAPFQKVWPISSRVETSTGSFRLVPPWQRQLRLLRSDEHVFVVPEGYITTFTEPVRVNVSEPGKYSRWEHLTPLDLPVGHSVRSYILHYQPEPKRVRPGRNRISGSITFEDPVLGLILLDNELNASAKFFPRPRAGGALRDFGLELTERLAGDVVSLSEDRRTLSLDLAGRFSDFVRVVVDASSAGKE